MGALRCPSCGSIVGVGAQKCQQCGQSMDIAALMAAGLVGSANTGPFLLFVLGVGALFLAIAFLYVKCQLP